jgi:hypothetical protein
LALRRLTPFLTWPSPTEQWRENPTKYLVRYDRSSVRPPHFLQAVGLNDLRSNELTDLLLEDQKDRVAVSNHIGLRVNCWSGTVVLRGSGATWCIRCHRYPLLRRHQGGAVLLRPGKCSCALMVAKRAVRRVVVDVVCILLAVEPAPRHQRKQQAAQ